MQTEDHTSATCRRCEALDSSALGEMAASHPLPARLQAHCRREVSNGVGAYNGTVAMTTLQDLHTIKPDQRLAWKRRDWWGPIPSCLADVTDGCQRGKVSFPEGCRWWEVVYTLLAGSRPRHLQASLSGLSEFRNRIHEIGREMW